jgi:hypothetical protein
MNQPKYLLQFVVSKGETTIELPLNITVPAAHPLPIVGDEIQLPSKIKDINNIEKDVFTIKSRRFIYGAAPIGLTGVIYLIIE